MKWNKTNCHKTTNVLLISRWEATFTWSTNISCFRPFCFIAPKALNYLAFQPFDMSVPDEGYSRNALCALNLISTFYYYHWVDTSAGGILIIDGIILPVVSASELTWFIRYIYYWNLHLRNNVIINITKVLFQNDLSRFWLTCFMPFGFIAPKTLNYFAF